MAFSKDILSINILPQIYYLKAYNLPTYRLQTSHCQTNCLQSYIRQPYLPSIGVSSTIRLATSILFTGMLSTTFHTHIYHPQISHLHDILFTDTPSTDIINRWNIYRHAIYLQITSYLLATSYLQTSCPLILNTSRQAYDVELGTNNTKLFTTVIGRFS